MNSVKKLNYSMLNILSNFLGDHTMSRHLIINLTSAKKTIIYIFKKNLKKDE